MKIQPLSEEKSGLDHKEWGKLKWLNTPAKVQDFLNSLKFNFEKKGDTNSSVQETLKRGSAQCFEGALVAAAALWVQGRKPMLLDLKAPRPDFDHVVALFSAKAGGSASPGGGKEYWGAISKTNHAVLRYREPVYESVRELAMSYFHEYFLGSTASRQARGKKTMRSFSKPFDLLRVSKMPFDTNPVKGGASWLTSKENLAELTHKLDRSPHTQILSKKQIKNLRKADKIEIKAGNITEYL